MFTRLLAGATRLSRWVALIGMFALLAAMLVTTADVCLRKTVQITVEGNVDVTQLLVMAAAYLAIPFAFMNDKHVAVTVLTDYLPLRGQRFMQGFAALLAVPLMAVFFIYGWQQAMLQYRMGDISQTIGIPMIYYWLPLLIGTGLSTVATFLLACGHLGAAVGGREEQR